MTGMEQMQAQQLERLQNWKPPLSLTCWVVVDKDGHFRPEDVRWKEKRGKGLLNFKRQQDKTGICGWQLCKARLSIDSTSK